MEFLGILFDLRTHGMKFMNTNNYSKADKAVLVAVLLHLISKGNLVVKEEKEGTSVVVTVEAQKSHDGEESVLRISKNEEIEELFSRLHLNEAYVEYKEQWILENFRGDRNDIESIKKANEILQWMKPVVDEKGHLLLAEDTVGNTVWAFALHHKNSGTISFGIYMKNRDGRPTKTQYVSPSVVKEMGTKVGNIIMNYHGTFQSQDATNGMMKLWCWNLAKKYRVQYQLDDYDQQDIFESLKEWIIENAGLKFKKCEEMIQPIYLNKVRDRMDIGIWADDIEFVFELLSIDEKAKDWLREAVKEKWIEPQLKANGDIARKAMNTSDRQREVYSRKNKNERYYKFVLNEEEIQMLMMSYEQNVNEEENKIVCRV